VASTLSPVAVSCVGLETGVVIRDHRFFLTEIEPVIGIGRRTAIEAAALGSGLQLGPGRAEHCLVCRSATSSAGMWRHCWNP